MKKKSRVLAALLVSSMLFMNYAPAFTYVNAASSVSDSDVKVDSTEEKRDVLTSGQFSYVVKSDSSVAVVKYLGTDKTVSIPEKIDGKKVTELEQEAVAYNDTVEYIIVPESVKSIGNAAFYRCANLKAVVLGSKSIGFGFTLAEASKNLRNIYIPEGFDALALSAILVNDLGEDGAKKVTLTQYDDVEKIVASFVETPDSTTESTTEEKPSSDTTTVKQTEATGSKTVTRNVAPKSLATQSSEDFVIEDGILVEYKGDGGAVEIPSDVTSISGSVFKDNTSITQITLPENLQSIGTNAFSGCTALESVTLPESLVTIGNSAFSGCSGMTGGLVIPAAVTSIGNDAFNGCSNLDGKLVIEAGTKTIGNYAFRNCSKLTGLELGNGITSIGSSAFSGCSGMIGDLVIPNSVTSVGGYAFYNCSGFDGTITLSENLTKIEDRTFYGCSNLTGTLTIPDKVQRIDWCDAFGGCEKLTDIVFGSGITYIDYDSFYGCTGAKTLTFLGTTVPSLGSDPARFFNSYRLKNLTTIYVPASTYTAYTNAYSGYVSQNTKFRSIGAENDFQIEDDVLVAYFGKGGEVTVPEDVTEIGSSAFQNNKEITKVTLPSNLTKVDYNAFKGCTALESVIFSENLETIGESAFSGCTALESVTLPESLVTIGNSAFSGCSGMTGGLVIPASVTSVGGCAFYGCSGLDGKLVIEAGTKTVGNYAFQNCSKLTGLELGNGITSIGEYAFSGCSGMTGDLVIPDSVTSIGNSAFSGCSGFNGTLTLSENITAIQSDAFYGCSNFTGTLTIPDKVKTINSFAFRGCSKVTDIVFGTGLTNVYSDYGGGAFRDCSGVKTITFLGTTVPIINESITATASNSNCKNALFGSYGFANLTTIYVPASAYSAYTSAYQSNVQSKTTFRSIGVEDDFQIEDGVLIAYFGEGGKVTIPSEVIEIGASAFQNNKTITEVIVSDSVTKVGNYAFNGCTGLTSVTLSEGLQTIGASAFAGCTALEGISLPEGLQTIGGSAFSGCSGMTGGLVIPASVTSVGGCAFYGCSGLDGKLVIEAGTKTVGNYAFQNCSKLTGLELGNGITSIGEYAFSGCSGMTGDLVIPDSVTSIGNSAFSGCSGFNGTLTLSENITAIQSDAFYGCSNFTGTLTIPDKVKTINSFAFRGCSKVTDIVFGTGLTNVYSDYGGGAFRDCSGVKTITFLGTTVPIINESITATASNSNCKNALFGSYGFANLTTIYVPADSYSAYVSAYGSNVPSSVSFVTDLLQAKITGLKATNVYSKTVALSWNPHLCEDVTGYIVYRDGEEIGRTTTCEYVDRELDVSTSYAYSVTGYTEGNAETAAATISVTTQPPKVNQIKTSNILNKVGIGSSTIYAYVANTNNLKKFEGKNAVANLYYVDNGERKPIGECTLSDSLGSPSTAVYTADWDISEVSDGDYTVWFSITDIDGIITEASQTITVDTTLPEKIINVTATGDISVIYLSWSISSEVDTTTYRIYRKSDLDSDFKLYAQINNRNTLNYSDTNVRSGRNYYYYVVGVNDFGLEGEASETAVATLDSDTTAPTVTKLTPSTGSYLRGNVSIGLVAQDNVAVTKSILYYSIDNGESWVQFGKASNGNFSYTLYTATLPDGVVKVKGVSYDAEENESDPMVYTYYIDNTGPEKVTGLSYVSTSITATLSWNDVSDNDISYFRVEVKDIDKGTYTKLTDVTKTLGANIYNLSPESSYVYRVIGYDIHGNRGTPSDDITIQTLGDTTNPVITQIRPTSGYYANSIPLNITATDEYNVRKMVIQTSVDRTEWTNAYVQVFTGSVNKSRTLSYALSIDDFEEGYIYVRAIAYDEANNESDSSENAPYVQHIIDRTAPDAPQGIAAQGNSGNIYVSWTQGAESDLGTYSLYRSESEDGTYTLVKSGLSVISYYDRNVSENVTYYYKLTVNDRAGNVSGFSESASASVIADTEKPNVVSVYPNSESVLGTGYKTISALVTDNQEVDSVLFEYKAGSPSFYSTLKQVTNVAAYSRNVTATVPVNEFNDGDTVYIRVTAIDKSGNTSESVETHYTIDLTPPSVESVYASYDDNSVLVSWNGLAEDDLIGYRVYRKTGQSGSYSLIAQRQAVSGQTLYSCNDNDLSMTQATYYYKIEAVDSCGNTSSIESTAVNIPDRTVHYPTANISCESTMEVGVEYIIDASASVGNNSIVSYLIDLGDGTTSTDRRTVHKYTEVGTYTITLTVTNDYGNQSVLCKTIEVKDRTLLGYAKIKIVDEDGNIVPNAPVYFDLGEPTQVIRATDSNGYVSFTADVGKHTVGCVIANNEWLPVKNDIIVKANEETAVTMTLIHHQLIDGNFVITRMTFDEIVAAGIDVSNPENQYIVNVNVKLQYGEGTVETSFKYNETTGETFAKPTIVDTKGGQKRAIYPYVICSLNSFDVNFDGGIGIGGSGSDDYNFSANSSVAFLDIPIGAATLKEFFEVNLHIINNATSEFSMLDNVVNLTVPNGLSIVNSYSSQNDSRVSISEIKGQTSKTITWILRGDEIGEYYLAADYSGILSEFNEPIYARFESSEPIQVYGMTNMKLVMEVADQLYHGTCYYNVSLINNSRDDVYMPTIETGDLLMETERFDATDKLIPEKKNNKSEEGDLGSENVLKAGEKITKHYMSIDQTIYSDSLLPLTNYAYSMQNTYGLEFEIIERDVSYFITNLDPSANSVEKAMLTLTDNQSAYEYIINNENYVYWNLYSSTESIDGLLPTNGQETLWNLLKFGAGDGDFKSLLGLDDSDLIKQMLADAMGLNASANSYHTQHLAKKWLEAADDWTNGKEWTIDLLGLDEVMANKIDEIGKAIPRVFHVIRTEYKYEFYTHVVVNGETQSEFFASIAAKITQVEVSETKWSKIFHKVFTHDSFKNVWTIIGLTLREATAIADTLKETDFDLGIFIAAQSNKEKCILFLDGVINGDVSGLPNKGDVKKVISTAKEMKEIVAGINVVQRIIENFAINTLNALLKTGVDVVLDKIDLLPNGIVLIVKAAMKISLYAIDNIFNVEENLELADKIRFVSITSQRTIQSVQEARKKFISSPDSYDAASDYMQLLSNLINLREIGESLAMKFGNNYVSLGGKFNPSSILEAYKEITGVSNANSFSQWHDVVQDRLSKIRVLLLKKPSTTDGTQPNAPKVSFNYTTNSTSQSFSSSYEYSVNNGESWTQCNNSPITVNPSAAPVDLQVRRISCEDTDETRTGSVTVWGVPYVEGVYANKTQDGYHIVNLDNNKHYQATFSQAQSSMSFSKALRAMPSSEIDIPSGYDSFDFNTDEEYDYIYIRSLADEYRPASYLCRLRINDMCKVSLESEAGGTFTGAGMYEYGQAVTLTAYADDLYVLSGWYMNGELVGTDESLTFTVYEDCNLTVRFVLANHNCNDYVDEWIVDVEPNCHQEGSRHGICTYCNKEVTETIPKTAHQAGEWEVITAATLLTEGVKVKHCEICGDEVEREVIPALTDDLGLTFDPTNEILRGVPEEMTPDELIAHYEELGLTVTVTDADGNEPDLIGTGCIVSVNGEEFTVIVNGDVTGDGEIDVFDLFAMTDHLNDEEELTGVYFIAACYLGNEEFDLFDLFAVQAHINQD